MVDREWLLGFTMDCEKGMQPSCFPSWIPERLSLSSLVQDFPFLSFIFSEDSGKSANFRRIYGDLHIGYHFTGKLQETQNQFFFLTGKFESRFFHITLTLVTWWGHLLHFISIIVTSPFNKDNILN